MSSITITTQSFGAVNSTVTGQAPATIVLELGTPGPQGEQGIQGPIGQTGATGPASAWGTIPGTLSAQTDLQNALDAKLGTSTAASTYYLQTNPAGYITSSALSPYETSAHAASTYAPLVSPSLSGTPLAPTATSGDNSTQIATTAFVQGAIIAGSAHAETLQATVRNSTGSTLAPFTVVYINGATGNKATVAKAQANAEATSAGTYAVTESSIANNADGNVIAAGVLSNIDTSAFADGDKLYLSPTVAGGVTTTKPSAPNHLVYVGVVTRSHPTQGTVSVRIQNGYELEELHNVAITSPATLDLLAYDSSTSLWKNQTFSMLGLETSAHASSTYYLASNPSSYITASALSPYLTSATAASTYQTITGMSSYLTTASAASTYAPLSSPSLTGTPLSTTAVANTNTTQIATTAFVVGQAGSATPLVDGTAAVGTSLRYARQDHVHPTDTSRAPLASPTFTGTPAAPTATAGTNTTQLATTAFVTAAVPAFETPFNTAKLTSTTTANNPKSLLGVIFSDKGIIVPMNSSFVTATSGGTASLYYGALLAYTPATGAGYGGAYYSIDGYSNGNTLNNFIDWSKTMGFSCVAIRGNTGFPSGITIRITLGKGVSGGTLTSKGVGLDIVSGQTYVKILTHNGTSLTTTDSTYPLATNLTSNYVHQMSVISYGNGTAELFVDGVSYGTASGAPTTAGTAGYTRFSMEHYADGSQPNGILGAQFQVPKVITSL